MITLITGIPGLIALIVCVRRGPARVDRCLSADLVVPAGLLPMVFYGTSDL